MMSEKRNEPYSVKVAWIRCQLGFALVRSAIASLCGHRSRLLKTTQPTSTVLVAAECHLLCLVDLANPLLELEINPSLFLYSFILVVVLAIQS